MLSHVIAQHRAALRVVEPALEAALVQVLEGSQAAPAVSVLGDGELVRAVGIASVCADSSRTPRFSASAVPTSSDSSTCCSP